MLHQGQLDFEIKQQSGIKLSDAQARAAGHVHGPMLVVAGAGTGKTTLLVERIAALIENGHAEAGRILAITFTENAAKELKDRVSRRLGSDVGQRVRASTFHAYCMGLLNDAGHSFGVLTEEDLFVYLMQRFGELPLNRYAKAANPGEFLDDLLEFFERCQDELASAPDYVKYAAGLRASGDLPRVLPQKLFAALTPEQIIERCREIAEVFTAVETMLERDNLGTFGHQIVRAVRLLQTDAEALKREQERTKFLLMDEFQDTNHAQIELARLLGGTAQNVFAVGDPDQAIYRFRGATSAAFDEFLIRFPKAKGVTLVENRRSVAAVLDAAYEVIKENPGVGVRPDSGEEFARKPLVAVRGAAGTRMAHAVQVIVAGTDESEAAEVANAIQRLRKTTALSDKPRFGVLYRAHWHRDAIIRELAERNIPFHMIRVNALETGEVRDLLALFRVIQNPADMESIFQISALPAFAVDPDALRAAMVDAPRGTGFESVLRSVTGGAAVLSFAGEARARAASLRSARSILDWLIERLQFKSTPALVALREFVRVWERKPITRHGTLNEFCAYMEHFPAGGGYIEAAPDDSGLPQDTVRLMTVHAAKGLEFEHVFVPKLSTASFPTNYKEPLFEFPVALQRSAPAAPPKDLHNQEERRLLYVAATRARDSLMLLGRRGRSRDGSPTGFLKPLVLGRKLPTREAAPVQLQTVHASAMQPASAVANWMLMPPARALESMALSASALQSYDDCPLKFKLEREWPVPGDVAANIHYGGLMHRLLRQFYDPVPGLPDVRALESFVQQLEAGLDKIEFDTAEHEKLFRRQARRQAELFFSLNAATPVDVLAAELPFEMEIEGVRVRGKIDRLDRTDSGFRVVDYKTGNPKNHIHAESSIQLSIYALAVQQQRGEIPAAVAYHNLEDGSVVEAKRNTAKLDEMKGQIVDVATRIAQGEFNPKPGFGCKYCDYRRFCPATEEKIYTIFKAAPAAGVN